MNAKVDRRDLEVQVIGAMLRWPAAIDDIMEIVRADFFYQPGFALAFSIMTGKHEKGQTVDAAILHAELIKNNSPLQTQVMTQAQVIASILETVTTGANGRYFAEQLRDLHLRTELGYIGNEMIRDAKECGDALDVIGNYEDRLVQLSQDFTSGEAVTLQQALIEVQQRIDSRAQNGSASGLPTGFNDIDQLTCGFQDSELALIAARPSVGKTALAINIANRMCQLGESVLFVSLEQSKAELTERLLCCESRVNTHHVRSGRLSSEDQQKLIEGFDRLTKLKLWIEDTCGQNSAKIGALVRRMKRKHKISVVFIDYLQLIEATDYKANRVQQVDDIAKRLKTLARSLKMPVVALCQVNRGAEDRAESKPKLSHLRESGGLEAHADTVWLLHRPMEADGPSKNCLSIDVAKQRNGPTGEVMLAFLSSFMRFENYAIG